MANVDFNVNLNAVEAVKTPQAQRKNAQPAASFGDELQSQIAKQNGVRFSAHALKRLDEKHVSLGESEQARLGAAVDKVQSKGADKSLVLMDNLALVVSARNRMVITAVDPSSAKDGVFTNIDSAVIA